MFKLNNVVASDVTQRTIIGFDEFGQFSVVKSDKDGSATLYHIGDPRGHTCLLCGRGWETTVSSLLDQYLLPDLGKWVHKGCFVGHLSLNHHDLFVDALVGARGFGALVRWDEVVFIPNEYDGGWDTSWFRVDLLDDIRIIFGRRKRVFEIRFENRPGSTVRNVFSESELSRCLNFGSGEKVTYEGRKDRILIHAWSDEKVRQYIGTFCSILLPPLGMIKEKNNGHA
jgi:hypothetical protein